MTCLVPRPDPQPAPSSPRAAFRRGFRHGAPFALVVAPLGLLFGVVATEAGLNLAEVMGMSILVTAGASQFAAVQMMADNVPTLMVLLAALAVNMRMAMYSAALTPHLGPASVWERALVAYSLVDQSYALAAHEFTVHPELPLSEKVAYFFGASCSVVPLWYLFTWVGATLGGAIPPEFALDFAVPITFLAMVAPMLRTAAHLAAAVVSVLLGLAFAWMPNSFGLMVASLAAMATGARVELWQNKRRAGQ